MNTIQQTVEFQVTPERLFNIYVDSKKHSEATMAKATVSRKAGGKFTAFDGMLAGRNLACFKSVKLPARSAKRNDEEPRKRFALHPTNFRVRDDN